MSEQLPSRPNLDHLKKQARQLLQAHQAGMSTATRRLRANLPRCQALSDQAILAMPFGLRDAQHVIALEYGLANWQALSAAVENATPARRYIPTCSFCHKTIDQVDKVITGPSVHICNECVDRGVQVHADVAQEGWSFTADQRSSFCGRDANGEYTDNQLQGSDTPTTIKVAIRDGAEDRICNGCIKLCTEVLVEERVQTTDINAVDQHGMTPLMQAIAEGKMALVNGLLQRGPDLHHKDDQGRTALDIALAAGHDGIVQLLKDAIAME